MISKDEPLKDPQKKDPSPSGEKIPIKVVDRRHWVERKPGDPEPKSTEKKYPTYIEELRAENERLKKNYSEEVDRVREDAKAAKGRWKVQADLDLAQALEKSLSPFLKVYDHLCHATEKAEGPVKDGLSLVMEELERAFKANGFQLHDPKNKAFNPDTMEAVGTIPAQPDEEEDCVAAVASVGLVSNEGRCISPAQVIITKKG